MAKEKVVTLITVLAQKYYLACYERQCLAYLRYFSPDLMNCLLRLVLLG
jgi:hypothetical protein